MFCAKNLKVLCINYRKLRTKWLITVITRTKSSAKPKTESYSHTILTPSTKFPTRSNYVVKEEIHRTAKFAELYNWQRENLKGEEFVLHDGPPYANGDLHMGHAVNKIIKDITNRSQVLQGNRVYYVPGWDCHGLPIELKALQKAKESQEDTTSPLEIRKIARSFALESVEKQKQVFKSWGVMADWDRQCYLTLDKSYVQQQLRQFYKMYKSGLIYRELKPVYWSPSSRTALAEAELEYDPQHQSKAVYVKFPLKNIPNAIQYLVDTASTPLSALIWTTTPWTLVANKAILYNPKLPYSIVSLSSQPGELFLVASDTIGSLEATLGVDINKVAEFEGALLSGSTYMRPLGAGAAALLAGAHVAAGKGTGLVHAAPAHGPDDFLAARTHRLPVECNVDEAGRYFDIHPSLDGLHVLKEGQDAVISLLRDSIVHQGTYVHSYPLDWRTKEPVILRASEQWFIDTAALKDKALEALSHIEIHPASRGSQSREGFAAQVSRRAYWCISRQRAWGVPVPALYAAAAPLVHEDIIERLCALIGERGADAWWTCDVRELLSYDVIEHFGLQGQDVRKGKDIMDIWLDSGLSWQTMNKKAKLYSEGIDQLTGWFQASLLTSLALNDDAPYESIFVHGFVVDDQKRKMSKSIGNVIDPLTITYGGRDKTKAPAYGIDTLRWWVAIHATQHSQIVISKKLLDDCQSEVIRVRHILKYLLGVISDLKTPRFHQKCDLNYFDAYMVKDTQDFLHQINDHYNNFRYNHVAKSILNFISNKVSGLYCHCVKDRLYCSQKDSAERLSAQLVAHTIFVALSKALGPILPHLVEEAWLHHPLYEKPFFYTQNLPVITTNIDKGVMETILSIKKDICAINKEDNLRKLTATISVNSSLFEDLSELNASDGVHDSVLTEILELSSVKLNVKEGDDWVIQLSQTANDQCRRCRKFNVVKKSDKCTRCEYVLNNISEVE